MATPPSWTQTVDTLFTTTWEYRKKKATEQAFMKTPLIYWLREKGRIENISGYRRIEIPVEYGQNTTLAWIGKGDTVPIQDSELVTMAYENWCYVAVSIIRWFQDDQQNRGEAAMIKLVDLKLGAAERTLWEEFERVMFSNGTGAKQPNGLMNLISTTPTTGVIHGLDRSLYPWWQNQSYQASGAASVTLVSDMRTAMNNIIRYTKAEISDIALVTDQTTFELYEDECVDIKILENTMMADAGFETIQFKGKPIMWCPSAPVGYMYLVNSNYLKLVCDETYWMEMTDWKSIPDQPNDRVAQIVCACNLVVSRPVVQNVIWGIAA